MKNIKAKSLTGFSKAFGLIGKKKITPVYFETCGGIHTFGMLSSIDVVILDSASTVVLLKEDLKPGRVFIWNPWYKKVLELPNGSIKKYGLLRGNKVTVLFE